VVPSLAGAEVFEDRRGGWIPNLDGVRRVVVHGGNLMRVASDQLSSNRMRPKRHNDLTIKEI
jgi:hypothetical protein